MTKMTIPIDWDVLNAATDGDSTAIKELVNLYLNQGSENIRALRAAIQSGKTALVADLAHRFLGSSRFFGATAIGKPLGALMQLGRSHQLGSPAIQHIDDAEREFGRIEEFFKEWSNSNAIHAQ